MRADYTIITPAVGLAVSLEDLKDHLRILHSEEDARIEGLLLAATDIAERMTGRSLITQTVELKLHTFPAGPIVLFLPEVTEIISVKYQDLSNVEQTVDPANYALFNSGLPNFLAPAYGYAWPSTYPVPHAVRVRYKAGYGDSPENVPASLRQGIMMLVAHMYENREPVLTGTIGTELPLGARTLLMMHRAHGVG